MSGEGDYSGVGWAVLKLPDPRCCSRVLFIKRVFTSLSPSNPLINHLRWMSHRGAIGWWDWVCELGYRHLWVQSAEHLSVLKTVLPSSFKSKSIANCLHSLKSHCPYQAVQLRERLTRGIVAIFGATAVNWLIACPSFSEAVNSSADLYLYFFWEKYDFFWEKYDFLWEKYDFFWEKYDFLWEK